MDVGQGQDALPGSGDLCLKHTECGNLGWSHFEFSVQWVKYAIFVLSKQLTNYFWEENSSWRFPSATVFLKKMCLSQWTKHLNSQLTTLIKMHVHHIYSSGSIHLCFEEWPIALWPCSCLTISLHPVCHDWCVPTPSCKPCIRTIRLIHATPGLLILSLSHAHNLTQMPINDPMISNNQRYCLVVPWDHFHSTPIAFCGWLEWPVFPFGTCISPNPSRLRVT